ncbi:MAG: ABC transporter permease [Verrucomicrobia bacterium]|nr:ABC transporter permease [Cytophagales bacterium]
MNFPFFIARRYFFAKKKTNFINIITGISMLGVCVGTAALIIVLSVFNGMEDLFRSLYSSFSSELQIKPRQGKTFEADEDFLNRVKRISGVATVAEVLEDNVVLVYRNAQAVVKMRGTNENILRQNGLDKKIQGGKFALEENGKSLALLGIGVQYRLSVPLNDDFHPLEVIFPKNKKRLNFNSPEALNRLAIRPVGVFAIEQTYDSDYIFVPFAFAEEVFETENKVSFLEVNITPEANLEKVQSELKEKLGENFIIQNRDEQHADILRAIKIEKLFVSLTLSFIIAIASFNIFFSLTMLAIEKQKDIAVMFALGASEEDVQRIFLSEGAIIASVGAVLGLFLGVGLCVLQQLTGMVKLGMETAVMNAYPIKMQFSDFVFTMLIIVTITLLASYFPARKAVAVNRQIVKI